MKVLSFKSKSEVIEEDKINRMFFHDLINHTHGVLLFLNQKITYNKGATSEELELLNHEIKLLQTLIQDHFQYTHKNLLNTNEYVPFSVLENSIQLLLKIYFQETVKISFETKGQIAFYESEKNRDKSLIHYPSVYRIINNLIKNMAEAETREMYFMFDYKDEGLYIETKNKIGQKLEKINVVEFLSRVILREEVKKPKGLGLDSIQELVKKEQGSFSFDIKDNFWTSKIFIPHAHVLKQKKSA